MHVNEVRAYQELGQHQKIAPNIVRYYGSWRQDKTHNILLEFVEGGTLEKLLNTDSQIVEGDLVEFWDRLLEIFDPICKIHCYADPQNHDQVFQG